MIDASGDQFKLATRDKQYITSIFDFSFEDEHSVHMVVALRVESQVLALVISATDLLPSCIRASAQDFHHLRSCRSNSGLPLIICS